MWHKTSKGRDISVRSSKAPALAGVTEQDRSSSRWTRLTRGFAAGCCSRGGNHMRRRWPVFLLLGGLFGSALLFRSEFQFMVTVGDSMHPTLENGDLLLVSKLAYEKAEPSRGDVVVVRYRDELVVKRIVGLPHEEVQVSHGHLFVNGVSFPEEHVESITPLEIGKGKLGPGRFAFLGDNRTVSAAQVVHGVAAKEDLVGKVVLSLRLWPRHHLQPSIKEA